MLQASCDLQAAAQKGQMQDVKAVLLNGADPNIANHWGVSCSSCICIFGIDAAFVSCDTLILIDTSDCSKHHILPHMAKHCSASFCCNHIGNGVLPVAKAVVMICQPVIACLLQGYTALHEAAGGGHVAAVEILLLNGADPKARDIRVRCSSCVSIFSIDTAYIKGLMLINTLSCSKCHVYVSCLMPHVAEHCTTHFCGNHVGNGVRRIAEAVVTLWQPAIVYLLQGSTAMHQAAAWDHVAVVETLLLHGADLEARDESVSFASLYKNFESLQHKLIIPMP